MLPFVFLDQARLGPIKAFAIFFVAAFLVGDWLSMWRARTTGHDTKSYRHFQVACLGGGLLFGHWIDLLFYHPRDIVNHPLSVLWFWEGMSSTGSLAGALMGAFLWKHFELAPRIRVRKEPMRLLPFADVNCAIYAIPFAIGRVGCALVHDHPGKLASPGSPFAVAWPLDENDGLHHVFGPLHVVWGSTPRYDLGLLEVFALTAIALVLAALWKKRLATGTFTGLACVMYGAVRFFLDRLRVTDGPEADLRHFGMTFAQYWSAAVVCVGAWLLVRALVRVRSQRIRECSAE
jgi:phosphatidylglycerol:prolipoprotein diacylglycerol transferase